MDVLVMLVMLGMLVMLSASNLPFVVTPTGEKHHSSFSQAAANQLTVQLSKLACRQTHKCRRAAAATHFLRDRPSTAAISKDRRGRRWSAFVTLLQTTNALRAQASPQLRREHL